VKPGSMTRLEGVPASHLTIWRRPGGMGQTKKRLGIAMCRTSISHNRRLCCHTIMRFHWARLLKRLARAR
jgi:hypothetical protein